MEINNMAELFYWRNVVIWILLNFIVVGGFHSAKFIWHDVLGKGTHIAENDAVKLSQR